jgi:MFS family permease
VSATPAVAAKTRLVTVPFVLIVASGLAYFLALAMLNPILPLYVDERLHGNGVAVGIGVGAFAVGAVVIRPFAGRIGDRRGRRVLLLAGAASVAAATALYGAVEHLAWLSAMRFFAGVGEAAFFVGAATMITDRAPLERRGEAVSYWSVAVYGGLAFGPVIGEWVLGPDDDRYLACWLVSAGFAALAFTLGLFTRESPDRPPPVEGVSHLVHRAAVGPGLVLFLGLVSLAGWSAFVKLYVENGLGRESVGGIFLLYGVLVLVVRIAGAKLPDRLGAVRAGRGALILGGAGVGIIAAWWGWNGLVLGTVVFALGMSLMYPALLLMALARAPDSERSAVVGTFSMFFDLSQGVGALIVGGSMEVFGFRGAFGAGTVASAIGLFVLARVGTMPGPGSHPAPVPCES